MPEHLRAACVAVVAVRALVVVGRGRPSVHSRHQSDPTAAPVRPGVPLARAVRRAGVARCRRPPCLPLHDVAADGGSRRRLRGGRVDHGVAAHGGRSRVTMVEEGPWIEPDAVEPCSGRDGAEVPPSGVVGDARFAAGRGPAEGRCVGGSTEINWTVAPVAFLPLGGLASRVRHRKGVHRRRAGQVRRAGRDGPWCLESAVRADCRRRRRSSAEPRSSAGDRSSSRGCSGTTSRAEA